MNCPTRISALLLCALATPTSACGGSRPTRAPATHATPAPPYRLGVEDVVEVTVWKEPGLSITAPVRPDGRITVPAVGELRALGRTARELEREIAARLTRIVTSPVVSVVVKEIGARVFVLGEVGQPGAYPLRGALSVLQAIALAGGLTEFADGDEIVILRRDASGRLRRLGFDFGDAVRGGDPIDLQPGDTIVVP